MLNSTFEFYDVTPPDGRILALFLHPYYRSIQLEIKKVINKAPVCF